MAISAACGCRSFELAREGGEACGEANSIFTIGGILVKKEPYHGTITESAPGTESAKQLRNLLRVKYPARLLRSDLSLYSLRDVQNDSRPAELSVKYGTLSKEKEIVRLKAQRFMWSMIALVCMLVVTVLIFIIVSSRCRTKHHLDRVRQEGYVRGLEQERQRIARELHDDVAGNLVGLQCQLRKLSVAESEKKVMEIARRVRCLSHELMPPEFSKKKFTRMLIDYVEQFNSSGRGIHIDLRDNSTFQWDTLIPEESHELYRIIQEAVSNALRHGGEGKIKIVLTGEADFGISVENPLSETRRESDGDGVGLWAIHSRAAIIGVFVSVEEKDNMFILKIKK